MEQMQKKEEKTMTKEQKKARYDWLVSEIKRLSSDYINELIADYVGELEDERDELKKELGIKS